MQYSKEHLNALKAAAGMPAAPVDFNFLSGILDPRITFTRASSATRFNSSGILETDATNTPRFDSDPVTLQAKGLLIEEQRTNLALNSVTGVRLLGGGPTFTAYSQDVIAPDGTLSGQRITTVGNRAFTDFALASNAQYSVSLWVWTLASPHQLTLQLKNRAADTLKATLTVNLTSSPQRVAVTGTTDGASPGLRLEYLNAQVGDVFFGLQIEVGAFPTSYIPTTGSQVTRAADNAVITGTNFSSWWNAAAGSVVVEYAHRSNTADTGRTLCGYDSGSPRFALRSIRQGGTNAPGFVAGNAASVGAINGLVLPDGTRKLALAYSAAGSSAIDSGQYVGSPFATPAPDFPAFYIGSNVNAAYVNTHILRIRYWPRRLPDSVLQKLTA